MNLNNKNVKIYISKINKVQDYIDENLYKDLTIENLSALVNFSPFYFHRLFKFVTKESMYSYIKRIRLERALALLKNDEEKSITDISLSLGFSNQASFAKAFKNKYGISASEFRKSKNGQVKNNSGKATNDLKLYNNNNNKIFPTSIKTSFVNEKKLIYIRHTGSYKGNEKLFSELFSKLYTWANARNLVKNDSTWLSMYHDRGDYTEDNKLRISVCLEVNVDVCTTGIISKCILSEGKYGIGRFELAADEYQSAWDYMLYNWLPESGYKLDDKIPYELYLSNENTKSNNKRIVYIYIPIIPL
ncbi:MAG: AraC family transcriptional regulator [Clostridiales bacterium]